MNPWAAGFLGYLIGRSSDRDLSDGIERAFVALGVVVMFSIGFAAADGLLMLILQIDDLFKPKWGGWLVLSEVIATLLVFLHVVVGEGIIATFLTLWCMAAFVAVIAASIYAGLKGFGVGVALALASTLFLQWLLQSYLPAVLDRFQTANENARSIKGDAACAPGTTVGLLALIPPLPTPLTLATASEWVTAVRRLGLSHSEFEAARRMVQDALGAEWKESRLPDPAVISTTTTIRAD
jgi:hypothetical protein